MIDAACSDGGGYRRNTSGGQVSPLRTRLICDGHLLCNSFEAVNWLDDPVQLELCMSCGHPGCQMGGYARICRLGGHLLWTLAVLDQHDRLGQLWRYEAIGALTLAGAIAST
ncbi:MAG: hypothetical protein AB7L28_21535 [Kofleriaceae bacterium]